MWVITVVFFAYLQGVSKKKTLIIIIKIIIKIHL